MSAPSSGDVDTISNIQASLLKEVVKRTASINAGDKLEYVVAMLHKAMESDKVSANVKEFMSDQNVKPKRPLRPRAEQLLELVRSL